jgi:adenylate kinase
MRCVPALAFIGGVSAVGKTTLLAQVPGRERTWRWCSAGKIIAEELTLPDLPTDDEATVLRYQDALVRGYQRRARGWTLPVVMDGHFTLPLRAGRMAIPVEIFRALGPRVLVVLSVPPEEIRQRLVRRDGDAPRAEVLADATAAEERAARAVAEALAIPLHCWPAEPSTVPALSRLIEGMRA